MFRRIFFWFVVLGASFGLDFLGITSQSQGFLFSYIIISFIISFGLLMFKKAELDSFTMFSGNFKFMMFLLFFVFIHAIKIFAAYLVFKFFMVDFYTAFMLITLGSAITTDGPKQKKQKQ